MFWIVTPAGSFGMLKLKFARLPRTLVGTPPAAMILTLIWFDPVRVTWATAVSLNGPMLMSALIWFGPSADSVMPCGMPPTLPSAVKVISAEALNWSIVALLSPWMCIPCSVAVRLAISSSPDPTLVALMVSLLALTSTVRKSRAARWVRNGNPWMVTLGLPDRPRDDWTWLAIWFSVYALAARSPTTSTTMITIKVMSGHLLRRRRIRGGGAW